MTQPGENAPALRSDPRLNVMMFLEYAVKGLWFPLAAMFLSDPLGFSQAEKGYIIGISLAVGAFLAPFVGGQLADRHFPTQKFLGALLIINGVLQIVTAYRTSFSAWLGEIPLPVDVML